MVKNQLHDRWIVESGATWQLTPHQDRFYTYESISGGFVLMGNDHVLDALGVSTVKIKLYDGTVYTVQGVWHVKDLEEEFIANWAIRWPWV